MIIGMAFSLQQEFALLPIEVQAQWLAEQTIETLDDILKEQWWWVSRPEQVPPETSYSIFLYLAGRGCVAPWTKIYLPLEDRHERIDVLADGGESIWVQSWTKNGPIVTRTDGAPFLKGYAQYWRVEFDNRSEIVVTDRHRFLSPQGWMRLTDVRVGQPLAVELPAQRETVSYSDACFDNTGWARITSISPAGFGPYYDMTVPETANYLAEGVYNHNSGKTRSGAEWIIERCERYPLSRAGAPTEHLVVAESIDDARAVCFEGEAGILRALERRGYEPEKDFHYTRSPKPKITFTEHGTRIKSMGADNVDAGRGGNNASIWVDEIVTWKNPERVWKEGLRPSLRGYIPGDRPRAFVTTTPKPIDILRGWLAKTDGSVAISRGSTFDNVLGLPEDFLEDMRNEYGDSAIGRQELYGEMLDGMAGALFSYTDINATRVDIGPEHVTCRAMAIDPSLTGHEDGDEMGVVVAFRDKRDHIYVLEDASIKLVGRDAALHCWRVFERWECDVLIYENNLGHAWLHQVLVDAYRELQREGFFPENTNPPLKPVRSFQGKQLRAEPVSMRYEQGRIHMVGKFPKLEGQLIGWDPLSSRDSPDRLDAFVHVCRYLMDGEKSKARIYSPVDYTVAALSTGGRSVGTGFRGGIIRRV